jgi:hypothetical protein
MDTAEQTGIQARTFRSAHVRSPRTLRPTGRTFSVNGAWSGMENREAMAVRAAGEPAECWYPLCLKELHEQGTALHAEVRQVRTQVDMNADKHPQAPQFALTAGSQRWYHTALLVPSNYRTPLDRLEHGGSTPTHHTRTHKLTHGKPHVDNRSQAESQRRQRHHCALQPTDQEKVE